MDAGILVPLSPFIMVVAIVFITRYFKSQDQKQLQETFRSAIEKGQQLTKEDFEVMRASFTKPPSNDVRTGLILLAVAAGIAIFGYVLSLEENDALYPLMGIAAIPGLIGAVFLGFGVWRLNNESKK